MSEVTKKDAVKEELAGIFAANNGRIPPEAVVEFARNENTALHGEFEWDDTEASHQFRLEQARRIIRLNIEVIDTPGGNVVAPVYVSLVADRKPGGGGYRSLTDVMSTADLREQLLQQALDEFQRVRRKYETLQELTPLFAALDKLTAKRKLQQKKKRQAAKA